jgi:uncharacterized RDD family membrane protein YckC
MADDQISVRSVTGVDITMTIAGPGSRSYAFVIDWHIRLLLALAWLLTGEVATKLADISKSYSTLLYTLPAMAIYFLYHPILEVAMRGRTPGKRMAGVRLLDLNGGVPSSMALIIRNLFRLVDSLPLFYVIGLVSCFITAHRIRIGDMAAGTLLIIDHSESEQTLERMEAVAGKTSLPLDALELVDQLLERWESLEPASRSQIAASLLARIEPGLGADAAAMLDEAQMRSRLQSYFNGTQAVHHV